MKKLLGKYVSLVDEPFGTPYKKGDIIEIVYTGLVYVGVEQYFCRRGYSFLYKEKVGFGNKICNISYYRQKKLERIMK